MNNEQTVLRTKAALIKRSAQTILVLLILVSMNAGPAQASWQEIYSEDFSSDPGWSTNNEARYYWDTEAENYFANQVNINYGGEYAYHETSFDGGSLLLEGDVLVDYCDYASGLRFGMFDTDMDAHLYGSYITVVFANADAGRIILLYAADSDDTTYGVHSVETYSTDTWYHVVLEYDAEQHTVTADISERDTGTPLTSVSLSGLGTFSADMTRVGTSNVRDGTYQAPGADAAGRFDNVVLYVPPFCPGVVNVEIDIKPGSYPNSINLGSHGLVPAAILSSDSFDATAVHPASVTLAGAGAAVRGNGKHDMVHTQDVNGDGLMDLVIQVETENLNPDEFQDGYAILAGETFDGVLFEGFDEIRIVPD